MEIAMNSVVAPSAKMKATKPVSGPGGGGVGAAAPMHSNNLIGFFNSPRGFKNENAINSKNGLALLASFTLHNVLNANKQNNHSSNLKHKNGFKTMPTNGFTNTAANAATPVKPSTNGGGGAKTKINASSNGFKEATAGTTNARVTTTTNSNIKSIKTINATQTAAAASSSSTAVAAVVEPASTIEGTTKEGTTITTTTGAPNSTIAVPNTPIASGAGVIKSTITTTTSISSLSVVNSVNKNNFQIPSDILDDLASRFIINVPDMELSNFIRICFQIELAHWFYLDFFCASVVEDDKEDKKKKKKLQACGIKQFAMQLFQHIPFLRKHLSSIDKILEDWKNYKLSVPTFGAILLSEDLKFCLLVQSYFAKCSWGFPKGKVNEHEDPLHCATREVYEETGYDITELIAPNDYIEGVINYQYTRLYIVCNVSLETLFTPRTRNEIKCCDWFPIDSLPISKNDAISKAKLGINANSFFMIMPFIKRLKKWVNDRRNGVDTRQKFPVVYQGQSDPAILGTSPKSNSPIQVTTAGNCNTNTTNQKILNSGSSNSNKKNKQQHNHNNSNSSDDKNALTNGTANGSGGSNVVNKIITTASGLNCNSSSYNAEQVAVESSITTNRSKRQRHKSMGDLDGIKETSLSHNNNNQDNCKSITSNSTASSSSATTTTITTVATAGSNQKRNVTKNVANASSNNTSTIKRQLFHSQSHCSSIQNQQQQQEKPAVSSFVIIRKEKQQMKAAAAQAEKAAKAQKQQQQLPAGVNGGRARVKSQSDKNGYQQQQQQSNKHHNNNNANSYLKQRSMIITNSNINATNNQQQQLLMSFTSEQRTSPPISGSVLLNSTAAAAAQNDIYNHFKSNTNATVHNGIVSSPSSMQQQQQNKTTKNVQSYEKAMDQTVANLQQPQQVHQQQQHHQQLQRMASGTNFPVRILKRTNSYQSSLQQKQPEKLQEQQQQMVEHQQAPLKFTPSFNSWTNFSFTKNLITNVFC